MNLPQTSDYVKSEILISSDKAREIGDLRIRQLIKILTKVDHEVIVDGVIKVFETNRPNSFYQDQEFAGRVLTTIKPKSERDLKEVLERTLPTWNKSIEQLPFWFRDNYGLEKVRDTFNSNTWPDHEKEQVETMRFWLQLR
jgi:hypothetical protein